MHILKDTQFYKMVFVDEFFKVNHMVSNNLSGGTFGTKISIKFNKSIYLFYLSYVFIDLKFFII